MGSKIAGVVNQINEIAIPTEDFTQIEENVTLDSQNSRVWLMSSQKLKEGTPLILDCLYHSRKQSMFFLRFSGNCIAYLNKCVHMPFRLDCESPSIFDLDQGKIKCSMHGIIFDPETGTSLSPTMCTGKRLTAIEIEEDNVGIWLLDPNIGLLINQ